MQSANCGLYNAVSIIHATKATQRMSANMSDKKYITVKELISAIDDTGDPPNEQCKSYATSIKDIVSAFPDDTEICGLPTLIGFVNVGGFRVYQIHPRNIEEELHDGLTELRCWANSRKEVNSVLQKREKSKRSFTKFGITLLILIIIAAIIIEGLNISGKFDDALGWVGAAVDGLGLVIGLIAFIYEIIDDSKSKKTVSATDDKVEIELKEKSKPKNVKIENNTGPTAGEDMNIIGDVITGSSNKPKDKSEPNNDDEGETK